MCERMQSKVEQEIKTDGADMKQSTGVIVQRELEGRKIILQ